MIDDPCRLNFGWIGAKAEELIDPDVDALYFALKGSGTHGTTTLDAELVANRTITGSGYTADNAQSFAYGTSIKCTGAAYVGVAIPAMATEDWGFRFRYLPLAHAGLRDVARWAGDEIAIQLNASNQWQVNDGSLRTQTAVSATNGTWYEVCLEREGLDMALKVNGAVVLSWTTSLDLAATTARVGSHNATNGTDGHYQDIRFYQKGRLAPHTPSRRGYTSQSRRSACGVGKL